MSNINTEKLLSVFNYFDGIIITDETSTILYYVNFCTDIYNLRRNEIIGKKILDIHPEIKEEDSTILKVLKTGKPIYDHVEHLYTPHGDTITNICSTIPIIQNGRIVGAIDYSRAIDDGKEKNIERGQIVLPNISSDENNLYHLSDIITMSKQVKDIKNQIPMIANTDSAVMIYGETGTGKEMIAESIHTSGPRSSKLFVSQNCAAIPDSLLESTLFGSVKGAFTGAEDTQGLFEIAEGGTVFLDEINSMSLTMQAKILKAIEDKEVKRIGSHKPIPFDVKVISALNQHPIRCIKEKKLREDLFYRLGTVLIKIPPLRERIADIPILVNHYIKRNNSIMNKNIMGASDEVMELFLSYSWPGNVRELKNAIEGAFNLIGSHLIEKENLPEYLTNHYESEHSSLMEIDESLSLNERIDEYEKRQIIMALDARKNIVDAAKMLKISKQSLNYKLLKYGLKGRR